MFEQIDLHVFLPVIYQYSCFFVYSAVAYHNNFTFRDESTKFGTEVENDIINKSGYRAIVSHVPLCGLPAFYICIHIV